ncbi:MAG: hypothetical protein M3032_11720 [Verrucomicrobiota bacterium]|nr:hypothetical protein [Verrucomicrobiota bacterium]
MINPNGDEFTKNDPTSGATNPGETHLSPSGAPRFESTASAPQTSSGGASDKWQESREKAAVVRDKAEFYLRENPIPTILGALAVGLVIGLAIRYATENDEPEIVSSKPLGNVDLSFLTVPFLWPFFKQVRHRYEDTAEVVKDRVGEGVDRLKKVDVDEYVKPLRKQWRSWTR